MAATLPRPTTSRVLRALTALSLPVVVFAAGCAASTPTTNPASTLPTTPSSPTTAPIQISERAADSTLVLHPGQTVQLSLHSTYWSDPVSSTPDVLSPDGPVSRTQVGRCPVGSGCGIVSVRFVAVERGSARLAAHRSSCGEAMACTGNQGRFTVTITVD